MGTARAQAHLRQILDHLKVAMLDEPQVYITFGWEKFDSDGQLTDEVTLRQIRALLETLLDEVKAREYALAS